MKKAKKILTLVACAVLLVALSVGATIAYLTETTKTVQNTFSIGDINFGDETLGGGLTEAEVDPYGEPADSNKEQIVDDGDANPKDYFTKEEYLDKAEDGEWDDRVARIQENTYKLVPSHTYLKDPTVVIGKNSEECYVRMIVTITDLADVKEVLGTDATTGYFLPQYFVGGWQADKWVTTGAVIEGDNKATYEFRYHIPVDTLDGNPLKLEPLFTTITVPDGIDNDALAKLSDMQINIVAHAIQTDGFADTTGENGETITAEQNAWATWPVTAVEHVKDTANNDTNTESGNTGTEAGDDEITG